MFAGPIHRIDIIISNKQNIGKEASGKGGGIYTFEGWIQRECK
jgi:hypothetical protein